MEVNVDEDATVLDHRSMTQDYKRHARHCVSALLDASLDTNYVITGSGTRRNDATGFPSQRSVCNNNKSFLRPWTSACCTDPNDLRKSNSISSFGSATLASQSQNNKENNFNPSSFSKDIKQPGVGTGNGGQGQGQSAAIQRPPMTSVHSEDHAYWYRRQKQQATALLTSELTSSLSTLLQRRQRSTLDEQKHM